MARVLVTGGSGFIGSNLVERLVRDGHQVTVLDNFSTGRRGNLEEVWREIEVVEGDLRSYERVHHAVRGRHIVFHQGALPSVPRSIQDPLTSSETNVGGTLNVLLAARSESVKRVIFASSSSVYGDAPGFPREEEQPTRPKAPYAVSKLAAELYCRVFSEVYGIETISLRYFNVYGRHQDPFSQYSAVIPKFITAMRADERPTVFGNGEQSRDFTHIDDVVEANVLAMDAGGAGGRVFNVARGEERTLNELVAAINGLLGTEIEPIYAEPRRGDVEHSLADISRAQEALGYNPRISLEEGLERTLASYGAAMSL